jgi:dihydropteroate synthase
VRPGGRKRARRRDRVAGAGRNLNRVTALLPWLTEEALDRVVVMGVLNVTPDSFSDGGRYSDLDAALAHGADMIRDGADLVDVGGESTRPGADRIDAATESGRVLPVIRGLAAAGVPTSIDTTRAEVAAAALAAGAAVVNDVSGGLADPDMAKMVAEAGCPWVLMHWRGHSARMQQLAAYGDVVAEVRDELRQRADAALAAGVAADKIIVDPGLGFAKTAEHNWRLCANLEQITSLGYPVLVGASRKSYLGHLLADANGDPRPTSQREAATIATSVLAAEAGAWGVRVHDVLGTVDALKVLRATRAAADRSPVTAQGKTTRAGDRITLSGLRFRGYHGVHDYEREHGQDFVVDVDLELSLAPAAATDDVADTVHYGELAARIAAIVTGEPVRLIETLAERIARACLEADRVSSATVTVHKPQAPLFDPGSPFSFRDVSVTVRRP